MTRRRVFPIVLVICLAMTAQRVAQAADDVLDVVPSDALGFLVVNRLAETDAKIQKTAQEMQLPVPGPLTSFKAKSRIKEGLDESGTGAVVLMPGAEGDSRPAVLMVLPVTDFAKLIEPFEPDDPAAPIVQVRSPEGGAVVAKLGGYAVATDRKHRQCLEKMLQAEKHVADDLTFLRPWLAENEVAGVLTTSGVKLLCAKAQEGLQAVRAGVAAAGGEKNPAIEGLKVYETLFAMADEQVTAVAVGGQIDEQGVVRIVKRVRFHASGEKARAGVPSQAPEEGLLAGLPAGPFMLAFGGTWGEATSEALMQFSVDLMKAMPDLYGLSDEQADKIMEISRESMKAIRGMSFMIGVGQPGEPLYGNMVFTMRLDDAQAYLGEYERQIEAMNEILREAQSPIMSAMKLRKIKVGDNPGLRLEMEMPALPGMEDVPNFAQLMENLFGPGGKIRIFMAAADEHTVVAAYTSKKSLRRAIKATKRPGAALAADDGVAKTAALLPPGAPLVGYWSPRGTIEFINQALSLFVPAGEKGFKLPDFSRTPPAGLAVTISPDEVQTQLVIPGEVLKATGAYVQDIRKMIAERNAL